MATTRHDRLVAGDTSPKTRRTDVIDQETSPARTGTTLAGDPKKATVASKPANVQKSPKKAGTAAKVREQKIPPDSAEEKRLARNAALRVWRTKNADRHRAYMKAWTEKRKAQKPGKAPAGAAPVTPAKKIESKKSKSPKKGGKA